MKKRSNIKQKIKDRKKYYNKIDIFLSRMAGILKIPTGLVHRYFSQRTVTTIRLNTLVQDAKTTYEQLINNGLELEAISWSKDTYIVKNKDKSEIAKLDSYRDGHFYIQNLSSMIPAIALSPTPQDIVLDMCAAPGSKTTQLAVMLNNKGEIIANDDDKHRVEKLQGVLDMFGVTNTTVRFGRGEFIGKREENHYDKILLDAPCSGEGMIYLKGDKPLRFWNIKKVKAFSKIQKDLIDSAFNALKKGGELVYSTCTLEPEENEGVITYLLNKYHNAEIMEIPVFKTIINEDSKRYIKKGLRIFNDTKYIDEVSKTYRICPHDRMMGFYVAKITKK